MLEEVTLTQDDLEEVSVDICNNIYIEYIRKYKRNIQISHEIRKYSAIRRI